MEPIKSFNEFISESVESNTKEAELLTAKGELLAKRKLATDETAKTQLEKSIATLDAQIDKLRETERAEASKDEQV